MRDKPKILRKDETGFGAKLEKSVTEAPKMELATPARNKQKKVVQETPSKPVQKQLPKAVSEPDVKSTANSGKRAALTNIRVVLKIPPEHQNTIERLGVGKSITKDAIASVFVDVWKHKCTPSKVTYDSTDRPVLQGEKLGEVNLPVPTTFIEQYHRDRDPLRVERKANIAYSVLAPIYHKVWQETLSEIERRLAL